MGSPTNDIITRFGWELDESSRKRVTKAFADLRKAAENGLDEKTVEKFGKRFGRLAKEIGLPADAADKLTNEIKQMGAELPQIIKFGDAFQEIYTNAERAGKEVKELSKIQLKQRAFDDVSRNVGLAGDIQSNLGALNALSGGQLGPVGEVVALVEELPRLKTAIVGLPQTLASAASAIGPFGFAVGAALAVIGLAVADFVSKANEQAAEIERVLDASRNVGRRIAEGLTNEEAAAEIERLTRLRQQEAEELAKQEAAYQSMADQLGLLTGAVQLFDSREEALTSTINDTRDTIRGYDAEINALERAMDGGELAANNAAAAEEKLQARREEQARLTEQLAQIEQQALDTTERYNNESVRINEDRRIAATREEEDFNERIADIRAAGAKRIEAIEKQGQARLAKLRGQLSDLPRKLTEDLADAERKAAEERQDILTDYTADANRAWENFWRKEAQIQRKAQLDRLRLEEDFRDRLNDAAAEGDVEAFLRAEREREKALSRQAEDIGEEAQTRADDFTAEQEQRRQDLARRLEELRTSLAQERAEIRTNFEERRAELLEALEAEKVALKENLAAAFAAISEQEQQLSEERKKRLQRQKEDEQRADAERNRAYQQELRLIQQRAIVAQKALQQELIATQKLEVAANRLAAATARIGKAETASSTRSSTSRASTRTTRNIPIGFATGGLAIATPGGIPARLAENENELVIPVGNAAGTGAAVEALNKLGGIVGGGSRGVGITVHVNDNRTVMVGDIASVSMVEQALAEYDTALTTQIVRGIEAARYSPSAA